jgi:GYF domain 2
MSPLAENSGSDIATLLLMIVVALGIFFLISRFGLWQQDEPRKPAMGDALPEGGWTAEHRVFLLEHGQQQGPFTEREIGEMMKAGKVDPKALCWQPGQEDWLPVGKVHGQA